jgi:antitoxin HigA-1
MAEYKAKRNPNRCPSHPGDVLADLIPDTGKSKVEIAERLGISRQHLYDVLARRKPLSPQVAARIGRLFGGGAGLWLRLQAAHDGWHAERDLADELRKIETLTAT